MDIDDKELFSSAMTDAPTPEPEATTEAPQEAEAVTPQQDDRPRDEHGRFAPRQAEPAADTPPQVTAEKEEAHVPSWRLREERERAESLQRRYDEERAQWQRQFHDMQRMQMQPKPEPKPQPDLFENPTGAIEYGVQQYVDPQIQELRQQIAQDREMRRLENEDASRERVIEKHGPELVRAAYEWLGQLMQKDPDAQRFYETRIHNPQARRPYEELVSAYQQYQRNSNPDAWAIQRAKELAAADPKYRDELMQSSQPQNRQVSSQPPGNITKLPPSLRNVPSSRAGNEDDGDMSDAALFRHATR